MQIENQTLTSDNRFPVVTTTYSPTNASLGLVLIAPAMGVPQSYYSKFATWLAERGYQVSTFDYAGMGKSLKASQLPLNKVSVDVLDWAADADWVLSALHDRAPNLPLYWIGHSLGGQIIPLVSHERITKAITIGTGSGYWRENSPSLKRIVWFMWYFAVPVSTRLVGYFPGKRLNMVGDLPLGVIQQWRRWCLHPEYVVGVEGEAMRAKYAAVCTPIESFSFTDDEYMSAQNTASIHGFYTHAPKTMRRFSPQEVNAPCIGHFGFFRDGFKNSLWQTLLNGLK